MTWRWSDEARLLVRPFATYRELAAAAPAVGLAAWRAPLFLLFSLACFVSWTTAGKLVLDHLLLAMPSWAFVPTIQLMMVVLVARAAGVSRPAPSLIDLYFRGHMPWMVLLSLVSAACLLPDGTWTLYRWMLSHHVLTAITLLAVSWCALLSYAFFRAGLGLSRPRATITCLAFYGGVIGLGVGYYVVTNQLPPIVGIMP